MILCLSGRCGVSGWVGLLRAPTVLIIIDFLVVVFLCWERHVKLQFCVSSGRAISIQRLPYSGLNRISDHLDSSSLLRPWASCLLNHRPATSVK